jgi:hypothetical protein
MEKTEVSAYVETSPGRFELNPAYSKEQEKATEAPVKEAKAKKVKAVK